MPLAGRGICRRTDRKSVTGQDVEPLCAADCGKIGRDCREMRGKAKNRSEHDVAGRLMTHPAGMLAAQEGFCGMGIDNEQANGDIERQIDRLKALVTSRKVAMTQLEDRNSDHSVGLAA